MYEQQVVEFFLVFVKGVDWDESRNYHQTVSDKLPVMCRKPDLIKTFEDEGRGSD